MVTNFLQQQAQTQHFTLGEPRSFRFNKAGTGLFFVRSKTGTDPVGCLWYIDLQASTLHEILLVDPANLPQPKDETVAEKTRRERLRESASGITTFSIDAAGSVAVFILGGELYVWQKEGVRVLLSGGVFDAHLSPDGTHVAFVKDDALQVLSLEDGASPVVIAHEQNPDITWGQADLIAAEEIGRVRGFWWSPDSKMLLAQRVDNSAVQTWHVSDPANPVQQPAQIRYPAAGQNNATLGLALFTLAGERTDVKWPRGFEYLADVFWNNDLPVVGVQSRDQKTVQYHAIMRDGTTQMLSEVTDKYWVDLEPVFQRANGQLACVTDIADMRVIKIADKKVTPDELIVRHICGELQDGRLIFSAGEKAEPKAWKIWSLDADGRCQPITKTNGVYSAYAQGGSLVLRHQPLHGQPQTKVLYDANGTQKELTINSFAAKPLLAASPCFLVSHTRKLHSALVLPQQSFDKKLPIILHPYGGPHAQQVLATERAYLDAQWWANQGFAVLIADGRGTPGRGPAWEKTIAGDLISPILEDQIEALHFAAAQDDRLDLSRVGIRGWSFGGYLAAYAVVRFPDIFHAAVAGAPVSDWRLYDTHYSERYLGHPAQNVAAYDGSSLLQEAHKLTRPLLIIHGFADDNVSIAHSLQLSSALVAAGKMHSVLPLSGATHMGGGADLGENLEKIQLEFFEKELRAQIL